MTPRPVLPKSVACHLGVCNTHVMLVVLHRILRAVGGRVEGAALGVDGGWWMAVWGVSMQRVRQHDRPKRYGKK